VKPRRPPEVCPVCDADVPPTAKACPNCGACHKSGWREDDDDGEYEIDYDVLDLPDSAYDSPAEARAARKRSGSGKGISLFWRVVAAVTLIAAFWCFWKWFLPG
jgi:hypothetical protein